jgi:hypothetical protein
LEKWPVSNFLVVRQTSTGATFAFEAADLRLASDLEDKTGERDGKDAMGSAVRVLNELVLS